MALYKYVYCYYYFFVQVYVIVDIPESDTEYRRAEMASKNVIGSIYHLLRPMS